MMTSGRARVRPITISLASAAVAISLAAACTLKPRARPALVPGLSPEAVRTRLAATDALAARGCYLCLRDASEAYQTLVPLAASADDPLPIYTKALENDLMLAIREIELRLPDSGARDRADALRLKVTTGAYDAYFSALDFLSNSANDRLSTVQDFQRLGAARQQLLTQFESLWPATPVAAYYYLALGRGSSYLREAKQDPQTIAATHPAQIALQYAALQSAQPLRPGATDEILAIEPRFAELRLFRGLRAIGGGNPEGARRELMAARELLPASLAVLSALAAVEFVYARHATALSLFEEVLSRGPDPQAQLGKAEALSYLKRHQQAIVELDDLLTDPSRNPGDKYYWRAWNKLQLQDAQPAYDDATAALRFMRSADAYRLAGIATFNLQRLPEARGYFESALKMYAEDCDSLQYLGQLDAADRNWPAAAGRFNDAAACFDMSITRMSAEVLKKEAQNTGGLLDEQIAAIKSDIDARRMLYAQSVQNAAIASRNAPASPAAGR